MTKVIAFLCTFGFALSNALAASPRPLPVPSPSPLPKQVETEVDTNKTKIDVVGISAEDPSQNGKPASSGELSPSNASSMGVGIQFHFGGPSKKADDDEDGDEEAPTKGSK
jgi:hypothetical protein